MKKLLTTIRKIYRNKALALSALIALSIANCFLGMVISAMLTTTQTPIEQGMTPNDMLVQVITTTINVIGTGAFLLFISNPWFWITMGIWLFIAAMITSVVGVLVYECIRTRN